MPNTARDKILEKYGVGKTSLSDQSSGSTTSRSGDTARNKLLQKYLIQGPPEPTGEQLAAAKKKEEDRKRALENNFSLNLKSDTGTSASTKENLVTGITPGKQETISQAPEKTLLQKTVDFFKSPFVRSDEAQVARDQVVYSVTKKLKDQYPDQDIDVSYVDKNLDDITKEMGIRQVPTTKESIEMAFTLAVGAGLVSAPVKTVTTIMKFIAVDKGVREAVNLAASVAKNEDYEFGAVKNYSDILPETANQYTKDYVDILGFLGSAKLTGVASDVAPKVMEALTKKLVTDFKLPSTVKIEADKVKDIFQTGEKISPEELKLVQDLGLDAAGYKKAVADGLEIDVPAEVIIRQVDRPYWSKLKNIIKAEPTDIIVKQETVGDQKTPQQTVPKLPEGKTKTTEAVPVGEPITTKTSGRTAPKQITEFTSAPINFDLLVRMNEFTPQENLAFGRKVIDTVNKNLGTEIEDPEGKVLPEGAVIKNIQSADGRPAQINQAGKVEIFLPNLMDDIGRLATGQKILAHEGIDAKVFEKLPEESFDDLATRYIQEVILHERGHQKSLSLTDAVMTQKLQKNVATARSGGKNEDIIKAQTELDKHFEKLEHKANEYVKNNREELLKEMFPKIKIRPQKTPTGTEKKLLNIPGQKKASVTGTESELLKKKLRLEESAARKGFEAGQKETKSRYDSLVEKIRDRNISLEEKRAELTKYASEFLPIRARGKRLKGIANLKTNSEKAFNKQLELIKKEANLSERKAAIREIQKELRATKVKVKNRFPNAKFSYDAQKELNRIRANVGGDYNLAQLKMVELISEFQTKNPDENLPEDILHETQMLRMVGVKDMTAKELRWTLDQIKSIKETGRTKMEIDRFNRDSEIDLSREKIIEVVTGGQELPSEKKSFKNTELAKSKKAELFEGLKDFATTKQFGLEDILDSLSYFDKGSKPFESYLSKYVHNQVTNSLKAQNDGEAISIARVHDSMKDIYGLKKNRDIMQLLEDLTTPVDLGYVKHADGKARKLIISRDQAIKKWMELQDETLKGSFEIGLNWNDAVIKKMESIMTKEDVDFAKWQLDFYREYYQGVNEIFVKDYGVDLPFNENYSPIARDVDVIVPENVLLAKEIGKYASAKNASLQNRVRNNIELKPVGSIETVIRHIAKMEHYKAWSETMYNFRRIFGDKDVRQSIIDFHGQRYLKVVDNFLNDFARDGVAREKIVAWVDKLRANTTRALLGLNKNVGLKQLVGVLNYGIELPVTDFFVGLQDFWRAPVAKAKFLYENSEILRERFGEGFERDIKFAIQRNIGRQIANTRNASELMFIFIRNADKLTVYHGAWAAYRSKFNELRREGTYTKEEIRREAIRYAENITNRIQETSQIDTLSEIQRGGSWAKLWTMFQSQPNKYYRVIVNAGRNIRAGRGSKTENVKRILWAWFIVPFIYNLIAERFVDEQYRSSKGQLAMKTAMGPLSYPLITGQMVQSIYGWTTGEPFKYQPSAVFAFMDDIQNGITKLKKEDIAVGTTYMIDAISKLTGVPSTVLTRPLRKKIKETPKKSGVSASF